LLVGFGVSTWLFFKEKIARERAVVAEQQQVRLRQKAEKFPTLIFIAQGLKYAKYSGELNPDLNKLAEAEAIYREALALGRDLYGNEHIEVVHTLCALGSLI